MRKLLDSREANGFLVHFAIWNLLFGMAILLNLLLNQFHCCCTIFNRERGRALFITRHTGLPPRVLLFSHMRRLLNNELQSHTCDMLRTSPVIITELPHQLFMAVDTISLSARCSAALKPAGLRRASQRTCRQELIGRSAAELAGRHN